MSRFMQREYAYARRASDGRRILGHDGRPVMHPRNRAPVANTQTLRLQIVSIRLNEHHWEWAYSRWLRNDGMFDTPTMTPFLHRKEFDI